ncbi:TrkA C-terminal domain-containing protein [Thermodesulfobacteriota bacterium]
MSLRQAEAIASSDIVGKPLKDISLPKDVRVIGIIHDDRVFIPSGDSIIYPGDRIVIFARKEAIPRLEKVLTVKLDYV